jgi:DNA polymerase-3 subunit gamma/tau
MTPAAPAGTVPAPPPSDPATAPESAGPASEDLAELWQQILAGLELPSTRMLLSQQAQLLRLDERRAVVRVAGTWMAMVHSRLPLLEKAVASALGSPRQVSLEAGGDSIGPRQSTSQPPPARTAPAPAASQTPQANGTIAADGSVTPPPPVAAPVVKEESGETRAAAPATSSAAIDTQASRLAEFFNGEVISGIIGDPQ